MALIVATLRALRGAFALALDDHGIAAHAHRAETEFVGARVGRMDQLVCSLGREGEALFVDMRSGTVEAMPLAVLGADITAIDSGTRHDHATGAYRERREECAAACRVGLQAELPTGCLALSSPRCPYCARPLGTRSRSSSPRDGSVMP